MEISKILAELRAERDRIDQAITAIESLSANARKVGRRGRPASAAATQGRTAQPRRRHRMTAAGRKRLSEMMKQRWAERRKKKSKVA